MTIAIIPMLIEALPMVTGVGAAVGAAAYAFIYLRKKNAETEASPQQESSLSQTELTVTTPPTLDLPEPTSNVAATAVASTTQPEQTAAPVVITPRNELSPEEQTKRQQKLQTLRHMLAATTCPAPTDSALSRHYDAMLTAKAEDCLENEAKMAQLFANYEAAQKPQSATVNVAVKAETPVSAAEEKCCVVPEDSMLKRHFLTQLRACIEKNKAPRPTDSTLRRHYEAMINAEIDHYLASH
jgi:hypothetical protein